MDAESAELRLAFVHDSIAQNGIACVVRKTPAKIRLQKEKIVAEKYVELDIIDFLEQCVLGHCNIIACGETGSGKTELIKYLASKIAENEKIITIEDTLELHLDKIFPTRDIVSMKTNNIATYTDILEACMRQNPKWILLSEVRSAEAVMAGLEILFLLVIIFCQLFMLTKAFFYFLAVCIVCLKPVRIWISF